MSGDASWSAIVRQSEIILSVPFSSQPLPRLCDVLLGVVSVESLYVTERI